MRYPELSNQLSVISFIKFINIRKLNFINAILTNKLIYEHVKIHGLLKLSILNH